jgi:hypothetical protein
MPGIPGGTEFEAQTRRLSELLHDAAETHHIVFRIVDGADDDWATWYSDWLVNLSELAEVLATQLVRSELTYVLVRLNKAYLAQKPEEPWEDFYARELLRYFTST